MARTSKTTPAPTSSAVGVDDTNFVSVPLDALREYGNNPRLNDHAVQQMANLIQAHGFRVPVLVRTQDDGSYLLVDGHLRLKAARRLGMAELPAFVVDDMTAEQVGAFRIAVNKASELAEWDMAKLKVEITSLAFQPTELPALLGMDDAALKRLAEGDTAPLTAPAAPAASAAPTRAAADRAGTKAATDMVSLSLDMTLAQREQALLVLEEFRLRENLPSKSAAFLRILAPHASRQPEEGTARKRSRS